MPLILFFILLMETAHPVWTIPASVEESIRRESSYGESLSIVTLFPAQPVKEVKGDEKNHMAYVAVTGERAYVFWKDKESRPRGIRLSLPSPAPFTLDYSRFRLLKEGMHRPELAFLYLFHRQALEESKEKAPQLLYAALFPDRPHPAIPYPSLDKEGLAELSRSADFIKRYDQPFFLLLQGEIKAFIDETAPAYD